MAGAIAFARPVIAQEAEPTAAEDAGFFERVTQFFSNMNSSDQGEWYLDRSLAGFRAYPLVQRGLRRMDAGEFDEADALFARALDRTPESATIWAIRGDLEIRRGNFGRAGERLARALELDPELAQAHLYRARVRREYGDAEGAAQDLASAINSGQLTDSQAATATVELAALEETTRPDTDEWRRMTDLPVAPEPAEEEAPELIPDAALAPAAPARIAAPAQSRPRPEPAIARIAQSLPWSPTPPEQKLGNLGYAFVNEGQCFPADANFQIAFNESTDPQFLIARADCYSAHGSPDLALEAFEQARDSGANLSDDEHLYVAQSLAYLYDQQGNYASSAAAWRTVNQIDPSPANRLGLARALAATGNADDAFAQLNNVDASRLDRTDRASFYSLRAASRAEPDPAGAAADLGQAIALEDSADLRLRHAVLLQQLGRTDAALNELERAYDLDTDNPEISMALAYAYTNAGRDAAAVPNYENALAAPNGNRFTAREDLAYAHLRLGNRRAAAQNFRRVVDNQDRYPQETEEDQQELEERMYRVRREVEMLERTWYAYAAGVYRSADINTSGVPQADRNQSQVGAEVGWFPLRGRLEAARNLGIYARAYGSFEPDTIEPRDESWQAGVGLRLKPFDFTDFILRAERLIAIGDDARNAWLFSAAHSWGIGGDWQPGGQSWTIANTYLEGAWIPEEPEFMSATGELFVGRAFPIARNLAFIPHGVASIRYSEDELVQNTLSEAGLGLGLRWWFDEDTYHAPRGTVDFQLQYRWFVFDDTALPLSDDGSIVGRVVVSR